MGASTIGGKVRAPRFTLGRLALLVGILAAASGATYLIAALMHVSHMLQNARDDTRREGQFKFRALELDRPVPIGFEAIRSPEQFQDAALFDGRFYLCGPAGLLA